MELRNGHLRLRSKQQATSSGSEHGQGTLDWVGLVLLVSLLMVVLASSLGIVPGTSLVQSLSRSLLCATSLSKDCLPEGSLEGAYGNEVARLVRANAPQILFGPDRLGMPVDFRSCRSPGCASGPDSGTIETSDAGEPATLFTRVIRHDGTIWIQYWAYYPESASLRGVPVLEDRGYHVHDWESAQVRLGPDGEVRQRASSHAGYNHSRSVFNWGSDMGSDVLSGVAEASGLRERGGWGEATGRWYVAGGSHAGNARDDDDGYTSTVPRTAIRLIPLEQIRGGPLARPADFTPITPPWQKRVWTDPEAEGTG
jgi:hypothetical protein